MAFVLLLFAFLGAQAASSLTSRSADDYPLEAVEHGWQGDVVADLTISPTGAVTACKIVQSSGHKVLDDATCNIMLKRARFTPAHDAKGNPVEDYFRTPPIHWRLQGRP